MKKIHLTEDEKKQIIGLYQSKNIILTDKNNNSINEAMKPRKLAKRLVKIWGKKAFEDFAFSSKALENIVNRKSGYIYEPGNPASTYLEGEDFLNAIERNLERWGNIDVHRFLMANDPTYLRDYIFKVLLPRYMDSQDEQTLNLITRMIEVALNKNEIIATGEFDKIASQLEFLLESIKSEKFRNAETKNGRNKILANTVPYDIANTKFGRFVDEMPFGQLRQTLRLIADWHKTAVEIEGDILRLIEKPGVNKDTTKNLIEKLNVLESKKDSAANSLYKELISRRGPIKDDALRESLKSLVESKNVQEIWTLTSDSYGLGRSLLKDATEVTSSIANMFEKGKRIDGLKRSLSNLITFLVHGNLATFRSLNEKIIASNSVGKGFRLWLARTLISELVAPLFGTGFVTLWEFGKWAVEYFGIQSENWGDGEFVSHVVEEFQKQFLKANQEGIAGYVPWLAGPLSDAFRCFLGGKSLKECSGIGKWENTPVNIAEIASYDDTEESFQKYLNDNDFAYTKAEKLGDNYKVFVLKDSQHGGNQTYWFKYEKINNVGTFTPQ